MQDCLGKGYTDKRVVACGGDQLTRERQTSRCA